jgi:hypothetical protein
MQGELHMQSSSSGVEHLVRRVECNMSLPPIYEVLLYTLSQIQKSTTSKQKPKKFHCMYGSYDKELLPWYFKFVEERTVQDKYYDTKTFELMSNFGLWPVIRMNIKTREIEYLVTKIDKDNTRNTHPFDSEQSMLAYLHEETDMNLEFNRDLIEFADFKTTKRTFESNLVTCCYSETTYRDGKINRSCSIKYHLKEDEEEGNRDSILREVFALLKLNPNGLHAIVEWLRINNVDTYYKVMHIKPEHPRGSLGYADVFSEEEEKSYSEFGEMLQSDFYKRIKERRKQCKASVTSLESQF